MATTLIKEKTTDEKDNIDMATDMVTDIDEDFVQAELVRREAKRLVKREQETNEFKEKLQDVLRIPLDSLLKKRYKEQGVPLPNGTLADAVTASIVIQAMAGNVGAYTTIRDTLGYKPADKVQNDVQIKVDMAPAVKELGEWCMEDDIVLQVIILVFILLFAIATFVVANEKNDEPVSPQCNCSQEHTRRWWCEYQQCSYFRDS